MTTVQYSNWLQLYPETWLHLPMNHTISHIVNTPICIHLCTKPTMTRLSIIIILLDLSLILHHITMLTSMEQDTQFYATPFLSVWALSRIYKDSPSSRFSIKANKQLFCYGYQIKLTKITKQVTNTSKNHCIGIGKEFEHRKLLYNQELTLTGASVWRKSYLAGYKNL